MKTNQTLSKCQFGISLLRCESHWPLGLRWVFLIFSPVCWMQFSELYKMHHKSCKLSFDEKKFTFSSDFQPPKRVDVDWRLSELWNLYWVCKNEVPTAKIGQPQFGLLFPPTPFAEEGYWAKQNLKGRCAISFARNVDSPLFYFFSSLYTSVFLGLE